MSFDITETIALLCITAIAGFSLYMLPDGSGKEIALSAVSGLVGYIARAAREAAKAS